MPFCPGQHPGFKVSVNRETAQRPLRVVCARDGPAVRAAGVSEAELVAAVGALCLARFFGRCVLGRTGRRGLVLVGGGALSLDGCLVAAGPCVGAVETLGLWGEPGLEPAQGGLGSGELLTFVRRPASGCLVEPAFARVLQLLAVVRHAFPRVGRLLAHVREALAFIRGRLATISGRVAHAGIRRGTLARIGLLGSAELMLGVQLLKVSRLLVVFLGLAVQRGGLAMDTGDRRIGVFGDQPLAALGGGAFAGRLLARALAEPASPTSPLSMLLAAHTGHGNTVPPANKRGKEGSIVLAPDDVRPSITNHRLTKGFVTATSCVIVTPDGTPDG